MKSYCLCLSVIVFLLVGCAAEKPLRLPGLSVAEDAQGGNSCVEIFPQGKWQFVHSIDFSMRDRAGTTMIGAITLDGNDIQCTLMTVEGFTLFEALFHDDTNFEVHRAVPPFDTSTFAKGLIRDIRAIFEPPPSSNMRAGTLADGTPVCRYTATAGSVVDILPERDACWQIKSYTAELEMDRSIVGRSCRRNGSSLIPDSLELKVPGRNGYTLKMNLISADNLNEI